MSFDPEFKFEKFENYYGEVDEVKKQVNECSVCGSHLIFSHISDYDHLCVKETSLCPDCGGENKKLIHVLN